MCRSFLEFLIFDQLPNEIPARIVILRFFIRRLQINWKQAATLEVEEIRCHDHEFTGHIDIQFLECLEILEVLGGDALNRDVIDVHLVPLNQVKQQIERSFEDLEFNFVVGIHRQRFVNVDQALSQGGLAVDPNAIHDAKAEPL